MLIVVNRQTKKNEEDIGGINGPFIAKSWILNWLANINIENAKAANLFLLVVVGLVLFNTFYY